jgi:hypothetical protein
MYVLACAWAWAWVCLLLKRWTALTCSPCLLLCRASLMSLQGESSWNRSSPSDLNGCGTFCYRSFNFKTYGRTADVKWLLFKFVDLRPDAVRPWRQLYSGSAAGEQTWAQGTKKDICCCYSLMDHVQRHFEFEHFAKHENTTVSARAAQAAAAPAAIRLTTLFCCWCWW